MILLSHHLEKVDMKEGLLVMVMMMPIMRLVIRVGIILRGGERGVACSMMIVGNGQEGIPLSAV